MKKLILSFFLTGIFTSFSFGQIPFSVSLLDSPAGQLLPTHPVWVKINPPSAPEYNVYAQPASGVYYDTLPAASVVTSITYDCNGNTINGIVVLPSSGSVQDSLIVNCPLPAAIRSCNSLLENLSSSGGLTLNATDSSSVVPVTNGVTEYTWNYGDGSGDTLFTSHAPVSHTYSSAGSYAVCLTVRVTDTANDIEVCQDQYCSDFTVGKPAGACGPVSINDSLHPTQLHRIDFTVYPTGPPLGGSGSVFVYDYGDGSRDTSTSVFMSHVYPDTGTYNFSVTQHRFNSFGDSICSGTYAKIVTLTSGGSCAADFGAQGTNGNMSLMDSSTYSLSSGRVLRYIINYGDGTVDTTGSTSNSHTYTSAGTYPVCYQVQVLDSTSGSVVCADSICKNFNVIYNCHLNVNDSTIFNSPDVYFNVWDVSGGAGTSSSVSIDFGDGSNISNPPSGYFLHSYPSQGSYSYTAWLYVTTSNGDTVCTDSRSGVVQAGSVSGNCSAGFTDSISGLSASFSNNSNPGNFPGTYVNYKWSFGDGDSSTAFNPSHTYSQPGTYTVCLEQYVIDSASSQVVCYADTCRSVTVGGNVICQANFSHSMIDSTIGRVGFVNQSSHTNLPSNAYVRYEWDFGDGNDSTTANPTHDFASPGSYTVCLVTEVVDSVTSGVLCADTVCQTVNVVPAPFCKTSYIVDTANSYFGDVYIWNNSDPANSDPGYSSSWSWDFGDGNGSNQPFPVHSYADPGFYEVCLSITSVNSSGDSCTSTFCDSLGVDSTGNLIYKNSNTGFTLNVLNPGEISLAENALAKAKVYPNPASKSFTIELPEMKQEVEWRLMDLKGAEVMRGAAEDSRKINVDVSLLTPGIYLLSLRSEDLPVKYQKLLIER